MIYIAVLCNS